MQLEFQIEIYASISNRTDFDIWTFYIIIKHSCQWTVEKGGRTVVDYLAHNIAINLNRIRKSKGMSLDIVAEQSGVSKSMLAQIEKGTANPSIGVLLCAIVTVIFLAINILATGFPTISDLPITNAFNPV